MLELAGVLDEVVTATVVTEAGDKLAFRHPFMRQALYDGIAAPMRAALHRHVAQTLAGTGAPVTRVADHLLAAPTAFDAWVVRWLVDNDTTGAIAVLREALDAPAVPEIWQTRHRALLANFRLGDLSRQHRPWV